MWAWKPISPIQCALRQFLFIFIFFSFSLVKVMFSSAWAALYSSNELWLRHTWPTICNASKNHFISYFIGAKMESEHSLSLMLFLNISHFISQSATSSYLFHHSSLLWELKLAWKKKIAEILGIKEKVKTDSTAFSWRTTTSPNTL